MMTFIEAFLWGTGISLGICVGLVAWLFLRTAAYKILGISDQFGIMRAYNRESLDALQTRNNLTVAQNEILQRAALAMEDDDEDDDSEAWKGHQE